MKTTLALMALGGLSTVVACSGGGGSKGVSGAGGATGAGGSSGVGGNGNLGVGGATFVVDAGAGGASIVVDAGGGDGAADAIAAIEAGPSADARDAAAERPADVALDAADGGVAEAVLFFGRWNRLADRAVTVNSGSHVTARFIGTALAARFDVTGNRTVFPTVTWSIDGQPWNEALVAASVSLASGLAPGAHDVILMARGLDENQARWTPPLVASITFLGFDVTGGALQPTVRPARPKIEFLGDSITEGVNMFGDRAGKAGAPWRTDGRIAYPCQTAQELGAEWRQVGFGRQGVTIVGNGGVPTAGNAFNLVYAGVRRDDWQADLVVINQGTNDAGAATAVFRPAYAAFLNLVRQGYPAAKIAALRPFGGAHAADIQAEVAARATAGDRNIVYIDTTGWLVAADFTDGTHPNPQGSGKVRLLLAAELRKLLP